MQDGVARSAGGGNLAILPSRALRLAGALLMASLIAGCGPADTKTSVPVPSGLLSADEVGGRAIGHGSKHFHNSSSCGLERSAFFSGFSNDNTMAYRRSTDGASELVLIGVRRTFKPPPQAEFDGLRDRIRSTACNKAPSSAHELTLDGVAIAFSAVWMNQDNQRVSTARSYSFQKPYFVMVSIERTDADPAPDELERLTRAQLKKTAAQD